jgi:cytochrome c peroxidase
MNKLILILLLLFTINCERGTKSSSSELLRKANILFAKKIKPIEVNIELANIGNRLFKDARLSGNNSQSCNSCHNVDNYGVDNLKISIGAYGIVGERNSPTVINSVYSFAQFWDGRAQNLVEQAKGPIISHGEMNSTIKDVESKINSDVDYVNDFKKVYNSKPNFQYIAEAIAEYEKTLVSNGNSNFDKYLKGEYKYSKSELRGLEYFFNFGCASCHSGNNLGGNSYAKFGILHPYSNTKDKGRFNITKNELDAYIFKIPSLRNVAKTAPYFHDGGVATLHDAIKTMGWVQLGLELKEQEIIDIENFLNTTTDQ